MHDLQPFGDFKLSGMGSKVGNPKLFVTENIQRKDFGAIEETNN